MVGVGGTLCPRPRESCSHGPKLSTHTWTPSGVVPGWQVCLPGHLCPPTPATQTLCLPACQGRQGPRGPSCWVRGSENAQPGCRLSNMNVLSYTGEEGCYPGSFADTF